jgi:hypothetical protein
MQQQLILLNISYMLLIYMTHIITVFMHNANESKLFALLVTLCALAFSNSGFLIIWLVHQAVDNF